MTSPSGRFSTSSKSAAWKTWPGLTAAPSSASEPPSGGEKGAPAYVNRQLSALSGFFKWLLAEGEIKTNPCDLVRRYKVSDESRTEGLSEADVKAMIEATNDGTLRGLRDRAILITLYYEGLRRGSLARPEMRDLRTHRQILVLRDTKTSDYKEIPLRREALIAARTISGCSRLKWGSLPASAPLFSYPSTISHAGRESRLK